MYNYSKSTLIEMMSSSQTFRILIQTSYALRQQIIESSENKLPSRKKKKTSKSAQAFLDPMEGPQSALAMTDLHEM